MLVTPGVARSRKPSMRFSTRHLLFLMALATLVLSGLGMGGVAVTLRHLSFARRLENIAPALGSPDRPALVFIEGDRSVAIGLGAPAQIDWSRATASGRLILPDGRAYLVRPASQAMVSSTGQGRLWVLSGDVGASQRSKLLAWLGGLGVIALASAVAALVLARPSPGGRASKTTPFIPFETQDPDAELQRRNRELEALNAVALSMGRSADVLATAGEMLDVVRALAQMDVGGVHRVDPSAGTLTLIAQRGLSPEFAEQIRVRPLDGSYVGEAARTGRLIVTHIDPASITDPKLTRLQATRAHRSQLALPIPVKGKTWGVMSLISQERRDFPQEEVKVLESVAHQI